jgi:hypothetical protein
MYSFQTYSTAPTPLTWHDAIRNVKTNRFDNFSRLNQTQYNETMNRIKEEYASVTDYILHRKFGYPRSLIMVDGKNLFKVNSVDKTFPRRDKVLSSETAGDKRSLSLEETSVLLPERDSVLPGESIRLLPNDFPYHFDPSISHHVLWSRDAIEDEEIKKILEAKLPSIIGKETIRYEDDYFYWCNPPNYKSIPEVWHAQVLTRRKE